MEDKEFKWVPWKRYVLILNIDGTDKLLGRFRRVESIRRQAVELSTYRGYIARIIDTRKNLTVLFNNGWIKFQEEEGKANENFTPGRYPRKG